MARPMQQPPLMDLTGNALPGPIFTPRPGWGGKLARWFRKNGTLTIFRILVLVASLLIIKSFFHAPRQIDMAALPTPTPDLNYHETAQRGDSISALATEALYEFIAAHPESPTLDPVEHVWVVLQLTRSIPHQSLNPGDTLTFSYDLVSTTVAKAPQINTVTRASLLPYVQ